MTNENKRVMDLTGPQMVKGAAGYEIDVDTYSMDGMESILALMGAQQLCGALNSSLSKGEFTEAEGEELCSVYNTEGFQAVISWLTTNHPEVFGESHLERAKVVATEK